MDLEYSAALSNLKTAIHWAGLLISVSISGAAFCIGFVGNRIASELAKNREAMSR